jgi:hypothetical protein
MRFRPALVLLLALPACGPAGSGDDGLDGYVPPALSAKEDSPAVVVRPPIRFGQPVADKTAGKKVLHCYPFEARDGAEVTFSTEGVAKGKAYLFGPADATGDFGAAVTETAIVSGQGPVTAKLVEDGAYRACVVATRKNVDFRATLACVGECGTDEALYRIRVNEATEAELMSALDPALATGLVAKRTEVGFFQTPHEAAEAAGLGDPREEAVFSLEWQRLFVSPKNGAGYGFSPASQAKKAPLLHGDGTVTWEAGSIVVPVKDLFDRATTSIDLVMYSFSSYGAELAAIQNAVRRGVKVRAMLDISTGSPIPYNQRMIEKLLESGVEVRVPKHKTKTLHQKFAIVDGVHAFNGSSNFSDKSSAVYAENRFFFLYRPEVVADFQAEWDLLWNTLSAPATKED